MSGSEIKRDLTFGLVSLVFTVLFFISIHFTVAEGFGIGISGKVFPRIIAVLLGILSLSLIVSRIRMLKRLSVDERIYVPLLPKAEWLRISLFILSLGVYILAFAYVGYVVTSTVYLLFLLRFMQAQNKLAICIITVVVPTLLWAFFTKLLGVQFTEALLF